MNLHPPRMCVFVSGDWHLVQMRDGLCFRLHLCICTPHATSNESLLSRYGAVEYACIVWSDHVVLALCRICPYMVLWQVVLVGVCFRISLCRLECRSVRLLVLGVLSFLVPRIWGQSPYMRVCICEYDVRGFVSFHNTAGGRVGLIVVGNTRV